MNQCGNGDLFLQLVGQGNFLLCFAGFIAAFIFKDKKWVLYSGLTAFSYFMMVYFHCDIKAIDPNKIYRYAIWMLNDLAWIYALYLLWKSELIHSNQFMIAFVAILAVEIMQVSRFIDRHFLDLQYTSEVYTMLIPVLNSILAISCWLPLKDKIWNKVKKWNILSQ